MRFARTLAATIGLFAAAGAQAASFADGFTAGLVFGDSLSDPGNLYAATGGAAPASPPYFDGRFSNGPVWSEVFTADFAAQGKFALNVAYGGARAVSDADGAPDFPDQIGFVEAAVPVAALGARPIAAIWFGANDIFDAVNAQSPSAEVEAAAVEAAEAIARNAGRLMALGVNDFLIVNQVDLGAAPAYATFNPADAADATLGAQTFNAALAGEIENLRGAGANVYDVDAFALFEAFLADASAFGFDDVSTPCVIGASVCDQAGLAGKLFWDPVHPTAAGHAIIADTVAARLAPVPLPAGGALLAAALVGLAALRRRA